MSGTRRFRAMRRAAAFHSSDQTDTRRDFLRWRLWRHRTQTRASRNRESVRRQTRSIQTVLQRGDDTTVVPLW